MGLLSTIVETVKDAATGATASYVRKKVSDYVTERLENADWDRAQKIMREAIEKQDRRREVPPPKRYIKVTRLDKV